jgi:hypothetical protein
VEIHKLLKCVLGTTNWTATAATCNDYTVITSTTSSFCQNMNTDVTDEGKVG